jgi:Tol biopolymer transport system component
MRAALIVFLGLIAGYNSPSDPGQQADPLTLRIAVSALHGPIRFSTISGANERTLITGDVNAQDWSPAGDRLVYVDERGNGGYALSTTDTLGNAVQLPVPLSSTWPQYSRDGQWIYFFTQNNNPPRIMRIRPNGTGMQDLIEGRFPAPAPDGSRIALSNPNGIWIGDPVTQQGGMVPNTAFGIATRWSPDGNWIAYRSNNTIVIIRPSGADKRTLQSSFTGGLSWSPDSRYLLSGNDSDGRLQLIDTNDYSTRLLSVTGTYPAWKPVL